MMPLKSKNSPRRGIVAVRGKKLAPIRELAKGTLNRE